MVLINLKNISKKFGAKDTEVTALRDVSIEINEGEIIAIVGTSGSGKSTLLNIIGTLDRQTTGEYILKNKNLDELNEHDLAKLRNKSFGFVVQNFALINDYTVYENIEIPLVYGKVKSSERRKIINQVLTKLDIQEKINKKPTELSGGQCQRVAIARAIVNDPQIILADEPTGALDKKTGEQVMKIFKALNKEGKTIIIVTHDPRIASQCNRIINIEDGMIKKD
ncbi:ABC transporter ATP-binding protein [Clostridium isatidis]|uniref:Peptide ABC transporter ATP-binding protein n=1 Tax=Clostridium isatidis TaxID=182773 RepID=A0A343JA37_9CLOT|nr:ABC transporter ATP-binding protein [Clostridium isatidis]ASW42395.1 peptide ABC transporter ATP-binding protein [Clostridium isatidis]